jgi:hypothetical protein
MKIITQQMKMITKEMRGGIFCYRTFAYSWNISTNNSWKSTYQYQ